MSLKVDKIEDKKHRQFISGLPCCVCLLEGSTQAAHIRTGNGAGTGYKSGDNHVVPLCTSTWPDRQGCHERQGANEKRFWEKNGGLEKVQKLALDLYAVKRNTYAALDLIRRFQ